MNESIINSLIESINCGECNQLYTADCIKILGQEDNMWFMSAICPECKTRALVATVVGEKDVESKTDLTKAEYLEIMDEDPVGTDEVIDMHQFLSNYSGNLSEILN